LSPPLDIESHRHDNKTIMVVDDEPDITLTYKIGLENYGFIVDIYNEPDLALSNFKAGLYDLAIIDMEMPKMNGFELYQKVMKIDDRLNVCFLTVGETATHYEMFRRNEVPPSSSLVSDLHLLT